MPFSSSRAVISRSWAAVLVSRRRAHGVGVGGAHDDRVAAHLHLDPEQAGQAVGVGAGYRCPHRASRCLGLT